MAFTPFESAIGGALIGLSAAAAYVVDGKITGISGVLGPGLRGCFKCEKLEGGHLWKLLFLAGLLAGGLANLGFNRSFAYPPALNFSPLRYAAAGIFIGAGTRLGRGCTSGHGICGLPRFSLRSWIAVPLFMFIAGCTVALTRHAFNLDSKQAWAVAELQWPPQWQFPLGALGSSLLMMGVVAVVPQRVRRVLSPLVFGTIFGLGLGCSGMTSQDKVLGFLDIGGTWDPSLAFVMGCGLCFSFPAFFLTERRAKEEPLAGGKFDNPPKFGNYGSLIIGNIFFGFGWGFIGVCPGPAFAALIPYLAEGWGAGLSYGLCFLAICVAWLVTDKLLQLDNCSSKPKGQKDSTEKNGAVATSVSEGSLGTKVAPASDDCKDCTGIAQGAPVCDDSTTMVIA